MSVKKTDLGTLTALAKGGYGEVFRVGANPLPGDMTPLAYKEFTSDFDAQRRSAAAAVAFRNALDQADRTELDQSTVWPRELVLGPGGEVSGFVMRLIPADFRCELLDSITAKKATKVRDIQWLGATRAQRDAAEIDLRDIEPLERLVLLGKLIYAVGRLHKHGWVFGDLSFKNAAFALDPPRIMLLDCDGAASLADTSRKQASTPNWDPPECPIQGGTGPRHLQDKVTDVYKLGLAILRCLTPGKGMTSTRNPDRLTNQLNAEGIALVTRTLEARRGDRPTAKELYAYFYKVVSPQVHPPEVRYARLVSPLCIRGMDARVEWQIQNAEELILTVAHARPQKVDLAMHPDGYIIKKPEPGPVFITVTNTFGTRRIDLGEITVYELPEFTPLKAGVLPRPEVPPLEAFTLEYIRPVLDAVPAVHIPEVPQIPALSPVDLIGDLKSALLRGTAVSVPLPRLNEAVADAARQVAGVVMDEAKEYAVARRQEYLASQPEAGSARP